MKLQFDAKQIAESLNTDATSPMKEISEKKEEANFDHRFCSQPIYNQK